VLANLYNGWKTVVAQLFWMSNIQNYERAARRLLSVCYHGIDMLYIVLLWLPYRHHHFGIYYRTHWTVEGCVFGAVSLCFLLVYEIFREPLNGFAPYSHGRRVLSLAWTSLVVKVKITRGKKWHFSALLAACVQFMFGKTSLAFSLCLWFKLANNITVWFFENQKLQAGCMVRTVTTATTL